MHNLKDLSFLYQRESQALLAQQDLLRNVLEPILWNRYHEKFESLQLDQNFLADCVVSPVYEKTTKRGVSGEWNSAVKFTFPDNHPVLKGELEVAYTRATQKDFFGEIIMEAFYFEDVKGMDRDAWLDWWHERMKVKLGKYYEKFGMVTSCNIGDYFNSRDKTIILQVPQISVVKNYFEVLEGCERFAVPFGDFSCNLYTANDYAIVKEKQVFDFRIFRGRVNERTETNGALPKSD